MPLTVDLDADVQKKFNEIAKKGEISPESLAKCVLTLWTIRGGGVVLGRKKGERQRIAIDWPTGFDLLNKSGDILTHIPKTKGVFSVSVLDKDWTTYGGK
ncbi:MAG: hypothetical protein QXR19_10960 [Candidatus Jordarchaeaceae archaeon]